MSEFKKTDAQKKAIDKITNSSATNIMFFGGARSAKTFLAVFILIVRACKCESNHAIVRNTFNSVKNSIFLETLPKVLSLAFSNLKVSWDRTNYRVVFPNNSTIRIFGLDDGDKLERILGLQFSTILVEECNQVPWSAVQKIKSRLAEKNELIKKVFYTQNPTSTASAYYQAFELKLDPVENEAFDSVTANDYLSIRMNPQDNIDNIDPAFISMLEKLPEAERKRFLLGEYSDSSAGLAVYAFNEIDHVSETAKRLNGTVILGVDFNFEYNSDILCSQTADQLYVWDEVQIEGDTYKKANELRKKVNGGDIIPDSTGANRSTKGISDHQILREAGFNIIKTHNPAVVDKIANLNRCFTLGIIKINPSCKKLIRDLKMLRWNKHGELDQKTDPSLSHLVDCLAYVCWKLYPLMDKRLSTQKQL